MRAGAPRGPRQARTGAIFYPLVSRARVVSICSRSQVLVLVLALALVLVLILVLGLISFHFVWSVSCRVVVCVALLCFVGIVLFW